MLFIQIEQFHGLQIVVGRFSVVNTLISFNLFNLAL